jgi:hypothetical protein
MSSYHHLLLRLLLLNIQLLMSSPAAATVNAYISELAPEGNLHYEQLLPSAATCSSHCKYIYLRIGSLRELAL